jgi:hypothetical protein
MEDIDAYATLLQVVARFMMHEVSDRILEES